MIGDVNSRGKGIGRAVIETVVDYLKSQGHRTIYTRYMLVNIGSRHLLQKSGFQELGDIYTDQDGLKWQNLILEIQSEEVTY